jgi:hypothetical protein
MASPRDRTAGSTEWFRNRVDKLLTCPEVLRRLKALTDLRDEGRCGFDLSRELTTYACMAVSPHQGRPAFLNRYWARGTGKTWKALAEFPDRLEKIADDVKIINKADPHFYARRRGNDLSRFELLRLQENCMQLPLMIRDYAKALRERNAAVVAATPRSGRSNGLFQLTELVNWMSGAHHDKEVSELLNTVAIALGEHKQFDAIAVAQARSRRRKRTPQT